MKKIGSLLSKKNLVKPNSLDPETIFYVFRQVIKEEYGKQGAENIKPVFFEDKKIFVKAKGSTWASEVLLRRKQLVKKINDQLGGNEIIDLAIAQ